MYNYYKETLFYGWYATSTQNNNLKIKYTQTWRWMITKWFMCLWAEITGDHIIYIMNKYVFNPKRHRKCLKKITSVFSSCASFCIVSFSSCFRTKASVNEGSRLKLRTYPSQLQQKKIIKKKKKKEEKKEKKEEVRFLLECYSGHYFSTSLHFSSAG